MQKKLIALAIASLAGSAFAQSNVTVYGLAYASYDFINVSGSNAGRGAPNYNRVTSNASRLGFKGAEDLGNGLSAIYKYETKIALDGGSGTSLFVSARDSFVGLKSNNLGTVKLGYFSGPNRAMLSKIDVVAYSEGVGDNTAILGKLGGRSKYFDDRYANSIAYVSPKFSGFEATVQYQANENKDDTTATGINTSLLEFGLTYNNGPFFAGLAHGKLKEKNNVAGSAVFKLGTDEEASETRLAGIYKFGDASIRGIVARTKADGSTGDLKQTVWGLGGTYNVTPNGKLVAQYYRANDVKGSLGATNLADTGAKFWVMGYEHSLSKRTTLTAHYAHLKNDSNVTAVAGTGKGYDFGDGKTGISSGSDVKFSALTFGIAHAF